VTAGLPSPFNAVRYHSLAGRPDTLPAVLEVTCRTENGIIQGVRHVDPAIK
jgi:anthranilate/para-aminobenzoate synthase component II